MLEERLRGGARVISMVAGPGYGKTILAARVISGWAGPTVWYSLDESDADLAVFAAHLDAALRAWSAQFRPLDVDNAATIGSPREVGTRFAEILAEAPERCLLAFDDVHAIEGSRSLDALTEFVERGAAIGARFILCGRAMPLSLHRIAAAGGLEHIGTRELECGPEEARKCLNRAGEREVDDEYAATLRGRQLPMLLA